MEDEKKKKRNKKKKNKQTKTAEDAVVGVGETTSVDQNHVINGQNDHAQVSETAEVEKGDVQNTEVDLDRHLPNGTEGSIFAEAEKPQLLQKEGTLQETIRQLENENNLHIQTEASLEEAIKQLRNENDSHIRKETTLEETINQLRKENDSHIRKEVTLEETITHLQNENHSHMQKEAGLEEKISRLLDERVTLGLKRASLEEKIKDLERDKASWILMENTTKETIDSLNDDIRKLRMQVVELEESRNNLIQENQQLLENVSGLQLQLQNLERSISSAHLSDRLIKPTSEHEDLNAQMEAALALVEKLVTENAELVEKVNELFVELDRRSMAAGFSSLVGMVGTVETASIANPTSESSENISVLGQNLGSLEFVPIKDERIGDNVDLEPAAGISNSSEAEDSGEIVQIPLDDNNVQDLESQAFLSDKNSAIPLSEAPLIGAPFRMISFVAKYVSGADLVSN